ncbi:hypothetical protein OSB04_004038 [Centaurea solstitialis]|uniref:Potassium channel domain-containing protein n=1 Tax=Centaurea solstitialis TaxID=347529 RepID=A0AA38WPF4_9ASTR|nr:hypothetical protein OSB04_004038 [Centaurea solstitialis]
MASNEVVVEVPSTTPPKPSESKTKTDNVFDLYVVAITCSIFMVVAMISFYFVIHQFQGKKANSFLDAIYFTVVLITSSGYKDLTPYSNLAILLSILFAIIGIGVFGTLVSLGAEFILATQPKADELLASVKHSDSKVKYSSIMKIKRKVLIIMALLVVHMSGGIVLFVFVGNMNFYRALYCVSSTITTVLSTDKCFSTKARRIIALIWILYGMITLSCVLYTFSEAWTQRSKWLFLKKNFKRNPELRALQPSDVDDDGFIPLEKYVLYKLKEMKRLRGDDSKTTIEDVQRVINKDNIEPGLEDSSTTLKGNQTPKPQNSNDIRNISIFFVIYMVLSTVTFFVVRYHISGKKTNTFLDVVYFSFVIMTSVGYGDLSPDDDPLTLIFASLFSLLGLFVIGLVLSMGLKVLDEQQEHRRRTEAGIASRALSKQKGSRHKFLFYKPRIAVTAKESKKVIRKKCIMVVVLFLIHMAIGTAILILIEDLDFIHALYCISITITSAGTEKCFSTKLGRVFALVWMLLGAIYKSYVLFAFTEVYTEIKQRSKELKSRITVTTEKTGRSL